MLSSCIFSSSQASSTDVDSPKSSKNKEESVGAVANNINAQDCDEDEDIGTDG